MTVLVEPSRGGEHLAALARVLERMPEIFSAGDRVGVKIHWGEVGNQSYLDPVYVREVVRWLRDMGVEPVVFDTTVLYSGGRRNGADALRTAAEHGYTEEYLGCPVVVGDGMDGSRVLDIPSVDHPGRHFDTVQVAGILTELDGFFLFNHFKGHMVAGFGGAIKNLSMGLASRAQKQRMHADSVRPRLRVSACVKCGICAQVCPTGAAAWEPGEYPEFDLDECIGCAQCIAMCPEVALRIQWEADPLAFQERLVETAAAIWPRLAGRTLVLDAAIRVTRLCDCLPGDNPEIAADFGFVGGTHPVEVDLAALDAVGEGPFDRAWPHIPWRRQFEYARELGFWPGE